MQKSIENSTFMQKSMENSTFMQKSLTYPHKVFHNSLGDYIHDDNAYLSKCCNSKEMLATHFI